MHHLNQMRSDGSEECGCEPDGWSCFVFVAGLLAEGVRASGKAAAALVESCTKAMSSFFDPAKMLTRSLGQCSRRSETLIEKVQSRQYVT